MNSSLLRLEDIYVEFETRRGPVSAVKGVSLDLPAGTTLGIVGESGSGKSVTAYAISRLLDRAGRVTAGRILFQGRDILRLSEREMRRLRGSSISMVFQNPRAALNPVLTVGRQLMDVLASHLELSKSQCRERALELLEKVRIRDPERRFNAYPHELSGGMCQRVVIALAMACRPALLIADEPTTGLDVTTQKAVIDLLSQLTADSQMGLILITHDLALAGQYCDRIAVMQDGRVLEVAAASTLFNNPTHPYTQRLVAASPNATSTMRTSGTIPAAPVVSVTEKPLLEVKSLIKRYGPVSAVQDVSFSIRPRESVGLVGESGSGKSTISRMVTRLIDQTSGSMFFEGEDIGAVAAREFHKSKFREAIQLVFQDPHESLNPRYTAFDSIAHPLRRLGRHSEREVRQIVEEYAAKAGLEMDLLSRFPHQLSGGQKARVGIARAIAVKPKLLVLDEPTAALDVSVQAVVLQLLHDLRHQEGLSYLFVSHDLNVIRMMCDRTIVLQHGRIVEEGESYSLFASPTAQYTKELLLSIPHFSAPSVASVSL